MLRLEPPLYVRVSGFDAIAYAINGDLVSVYLRGWRKFGELDMRTFAFQQPGERLLRHASPETIDEKRRSLYKEPEQFREWSRKEVALAESFMGLKSPSVGWVQRDVFNLLLNERLDAKQLVQACKAMGVETTKVVRLFGGGWMFFGDSDVTHTIVLEKLSLIHI